MTEKGVSNMTNGAGVRAILPATDGANFPQPVAELQARRMPSVRALFAAGVFFLAALALSAPPAWGQEPPPFQSPVYRPGGISRSSKTRWQEPPPFQSPVYRVDLVAGTGEYVSSDQIGKNDGGPAVAAHMNPEDIALDAAGNLFLADYYRVRRIDAATGIITTVAGNGKDPYSGDGGPAVQAQFDGVRSVALDAAGNIFISEYARVRRVDAATGIIDTVAGTGERGYSGEGGPAVEAKLDAGHIAVDGAGNLFIADNGVRTVRRVDAATGIINTVAGGGSLRSADGLQATEAQLRSISAIAFDGAGNLFIADGYHILRVDAATGIANTIAGDPERRRGNDLGATETDVELGTAVDFRLSGVNTNAMAVDAAGNVFFADWLHVFRIDAAAGIVSRIAGTGEYDYRAGGAVYDGDGRLANKAAIAYARGLAVDAAGNVFFVSNNRVRRLTPWTGGDPVIAEGGVVQAGGTPLVDRISPNTLISVFGQDFSPPGAPMLGAGLDASGRVSVNLADTCLEIGRYGSTGRGIRDIRGKLVPLFLVSPTQINAQAPHDLTPGEDAQVTVIRGCGTADALRSVEVSVRGVAITPAFFNVVNNPDGRNPLVAQHGGGPALVGPPELGAAFTPAAPGEIVTLYGTGFGPTEPALEAGVVPGAPAGLAYSVSFNVGGKAVLPEDVLYAGAAPCCAGLYQFTVRLPADLPDGDAAVTATVLGVFTPRGPFLAVRSR